MSYNTSNIGVPFIFNLRNEDGQNAKLTEDRYEVFIEGDFVGEKTLFAQNETINSVADFLKSQGFENVEVEQDGDHIVVHCDDHEEANEMKAALKVYLKNR